MESITKHWKKWRAQIARSGVRKSKVFATKQQARDWAAGEETRLRDDKSSACRLPFSEVLRRYGTEVSPKKRSHTWEVARIEKWRADPIGKIRICDLGADDLADWRDRRLREVSAGMVRRERNLMSAILTRARREWRYIDVNPMADVAAPKEPQPRNRLVSDAELEKLLFVACSDLTTKRARAVHAFRLALETGMRAGELLALTGEAFDPDLRVADLSRTNNGECRDVALSKEAARLIKALPDPDRLFAVDCPWSGILGQMTA